MLHEPSLSEMGSQFVSDDISYLSLHDMDIVSVWNTLRFTLIVW